MFRKIFYIIIVLFLSLFYSNISFATNKNISTQSVINYTIFGNIDIIKFKFSSKYNKNIYHKSYEDNNILDKFFIFINTDNLEEKQKFLKKIFIIAENNKNIQYILLDIRKNAKYQNIKINPASRFIANFLQNNNNIIYDHNGWLNYNAATLKKDDIISNILKKTYNYETVAFDRVGNLSILEKNNIFYYIINNNWTEDLLLFNIISK